MKRNESSESQYIDPRIIKRLRIYMIIAMVILFVIIFEVSQGIFNVLLTIAGVFVGMMIGIIVSRMFHISWDEESNIVISNIDWIGAVILVFYIIFTLTRTYFLGYWIEGTPLFATILSLTAGTMLGRIIGTRHVVNKILKALKIDGILRQ